MKKYILFFLMINLFTGCDYFNTYSLKNKSGQILLVEVVVNDKYIDSKNIKESMMYNLRSNKIISLDTINYKLKLSLDSDEEFMFGGATNGYPLLDRYDQITIYKEDSLVFYGNQYIIQNLYTNSKQDHTEVLNIY
ncbi:hypothetical protein [Paenimyroides aestuarii]|uniref:Lipoprotein n=1 Tax=Paenimyroides aestuarii TaxID=2968490 RepID=A0ABY5NWG2_9FLAO|nr:hypothetical protein [Paenimyroides aestuarii]UUV22774.1 hypothetical protein NPX36_06960 [Paenimyroides aestuarii]